MIQVEFFFLDDYCVIGQKCEVGVANAKKQHAASRFYDGLRIKQ